MTNLATELNSLTVPKNALHHGATIDLAITASPRLRVPASPIPLVPASPRLRVSASPIPRVPASPRPRSASPPLPLTRRAFNGRLAFAAAGLVSMGTTRAQTGRAATPAERGPFLDMHTHLGQTWNSTQVLLAEDLLRWMDAHNIAEAVVLPLVSPESSSFPLTTDFVLAQTAPFRDRLIPFCSIDPRTSYSGGHEGLVAMLARYRDQGAKGFGEHKPGLPIDDPRNLALYAACQAVKLSILFHLDTERNMDQPGLPGLAKALESAPGTNFIGHGPGWWASISGGITQADLGGYPRGPVAPGGAIDALMDKYPNLHGDLSAGSGANAISRDPGFGRDFLIRRADRLMFGTDFLSPGQEVPQLELFATIDLPREVQDKIFRGNARRLLGLA